MQLHTYITTDRYKLWAAMPDLKTASTKVTQGSLEISKLSVNIALCWIFEHCQSVSKVYFGA